MGECECLILGPEGAGKTLLLKKLTHNAVSNAKGKASNVDTSIPSTEFTRGVMHTIPTAGTNVAMLEFANGTCTLRECGPSIAPLWKSYFKDCHMLIFVIDTANPTQLSAATMLLLDVLAAKELEHKPVLIFLNKSDCELKMSSVELKSIMRMDDIIKHASQQLKVVKGSCTTEDGLDIITDWIYSIANVQ